MVASHDGEEPLGVGPRPLLDVFDPSAIYSQRHFVFGLAGDRASVTADATRLVDDESVLQSPLLSINTYQVQGVRSPFFYYEVIFL